MCIGEQAGINGVAKVIREVKPGELVLAHLLGEEIKKSVFAIRQEIKREAMMSNAISV